VKDILGRESHKRKEKGKSLRLKSDKSRPKDRQPGRE